MYIYDGSEFVDVMNSEHSSRSIYSVLSMAILFLIQIE